jgi:hypothetical protein
MPRALRFLVTQHDHTEQFTEIKHWIRQRNTHVHEVSGKRRRPKFVTLSNVRRHFLGVLKSLSVCRISSMKWATRTTMGSFVLFIVIDIPSFILLDGKVGCKSTTTTTTITTTNTTTTTTTTTTNIIPSTTNTTTTIAATTTERARYCHY